eukprot:scaffold886_cov317-Prasinococcus_capsulatus_cf.AAC.21
MSGHVPEMPRRGPRRRCCSGRARGAARRGAARTESLPGCLRACPCAPRLEIVERRWCVAVAGRVGTRTSRACVGWARATSELRLARGAVGFAWYAACSMAPCPLAAGLRALPARSVPKQRCMPSSQKLGRTRTCSLPRRCRAVASASDSSSPPPWNASPEDQGNSPSSRPPSTRDEGPAAAPRSSGPSPQGLVPVPIVPGSGTRSGRCSAQCMQGVACPTRVPFCSRRSVLLL